MTRARPGPASRAAAPSAAERQAEILRALNNAPDADAPPLELSAARFALDGEEYALLSFPLIPQERWRGLSAAEREVITAVLAGATNAQVARQRRTSIRTTEAQLASAFRKLRVQSRGELVAYCLRGAPRAR